jgi:hypothetical protein
MPTVQVRMAPPLHERFIQECEKREMTPSDFIRRLVDAALEQIDTPTTYLRRMPGERAPLSSGGHEAAHKRIASPGVRGFAIGGGEITAQDQLTSRQAIIEKKRK